MAKKGSGPPTDYHNQRIQRYVSRPHIQVPTIPQTSGQPDSAKARRDAVDIGKALRESGAKTPQKVAAPAQNPPQGQTNIALRDAINASKNTTVRGVENVQAGQTPGTRSEVAAQPNQTNKELAAQIAAGRNQTVRGVEHTSEANLQSPSPTPNNAQNKSTTLSRGRSLERSGQSIRPPPTASAEIANRNQQSIAYQKTHDDVKSKPGQTPDKGKEKEPDKNRDKGKDKEHDR